MRELELSLRVYAGSRGDFRDGAIAQDLLDYAAEIIRWQIESTWRAFYFPDARVDYRFIFRIEAARTSPVVNRWWSNGVELFEEDNEGAVRVADAFALAEAARFDNIAVVFPYWHHATAPRFTRGGFESNGDNPDDRGTFLRTSTMMGLDIQALSSGRNLSAAHEAGHLMGIRDAVSSELSIMRSQAEEPRRYMNRHAQYWLHQAVERPVQGVIWRGDRLPESAPRRRRRRRRRRG